jgi:hypothetical protein
LRRARRRPLTARRRGAGGLLRPHLLLDRRDRVDQADPPLLGRGAPLLVEQLERPEIMIEEALGPTQALELAVATEGRLVGLDDRQQHPGARGCITRLRRDLRERPLEQRDRAVRIARRQLLLGLGEGHARGVHIRPDRARRDRPTEADRQREHRRQPAAQAQHTVRPRAGPRGLDDRRTNLRFGHGSCHLAPVVGTAEAARRE